MSFTVVDESDHWLVVDKPAPLLVYRSKPAQTDSLLDRLEQIYAFEIANGAKFSIITRLDRETSGVCLLAKHHEAAREMGKAMEARAFSKTYEALCWGWPEQDEFVHQGSIVRAGEVEDTNIYVRQRVHPSGVEARTRFRVIERFEVETSNGSRFARIEARPETGRTHQIRVHLADLGFPIVGDKIYGRPGGQAYLDFIDRGWTRKLEDKLLLRRHALHASRLEWPAHEVVWQAVWPDFLRLDGRSPQKTRFDE